VAGVQSVCAGLSIAEFETWSLEFFMTIAEREAGDLILDARFHCDSPLVNPLKRHASLSGICGVNTFNLGESIAPPVSINLVKISSGVSVSTHPAAA
jgi:hypothetical protein